MVCTLTSLGFLTRRHNRTSKLGLYTSVLTQLSWFCTAKVCQFHFFLLWYFKTEHNSTYSHATFTFPDEAAAIWWRLKVIFCQQIWNGSHYSNFEFWWSKFGTGAPEDFLFTIFYDAPVRDQIEFVLLPTPFCQRSLRMSPF